MGRQSENKMMTWLEIIATLGVILSLLFVGFEIRRNTAIARGQARQELAQLNQEWLILLRQDAEFETLWDLVDKSALKNYGFAAVEMFTAPQFERYWVEQKWRNAFNKDFADLVVGLRLAAREEDGNG